MIDLRPYQAGLVNDLREALRQDRRVCLVLPTGGGKTIVFGFIVSEAIARGRRVLILVHRRELIRQTIDKLRFFGVEAVGVIAAGWPADADQPVQVASIATLARRRARVEDVALVIVDECHHSAAGSWAAVLDMYAGTFLIGCTATPERLDGRGLRDQFDRLVVGPTAQELVDLGFLAEVRILTAPRLPDLRGIKRIGGDFAVNALGEVMSEPTLIGDAVQHYRDHGEGRPAIAFCVTIAHAKAVAAQFHADGYRAASVDGNMPTDERDAAIGGLAAGSLDVVTSCALISEGLDIPDVGCAILLRPTQSLALYLQQIGRCRRPKADGRPALILDHAGNAVRHGHPSAARLWSLDGRPARVAAEKAAREAEEAEERKRRPAPIVLSGRLVELASGTFDVERLRSMPLRSALKLCPTEADVYRLAEVRGYKRGWAWHVCCERATREAAEQIWQAAGPWPGQST